MSITQRLHKKLPELIHEFSKVTGYKINLRKSVAFLYTSNEATERETQKAIPFTTAPKIRKCLVANLTKDLYSENYKTPMKEINENTNK